VRNGSGTTAGEQGVIPFRLATDNLVWGENFQAQLKRPNRYVDEKYLYRLDYPEGWAFSTSLSGASGNSPAGQGTLDLTLKPRTNQAPDQFLKSHFKTGVLRDGQGFTKPGLIGYLALLPRKDGPDKRIAVVYYRRYAYVFEGSLAKSVHNDKQQIQSLDNQLQGIILSFAPLSARQLASQSPKRIHYVKATQHTTFAALAKQLKLGKYGEEELRLINGFYPRGEPEPGSWIKVIQ
jgi:predicted Zn-dependent protease